MSTKETKIVRVIKDQNNFKELFQQWNQDNQTNVKCSEVDCSNDVESNAYIVEATSNLNKQLIVPLCKSCYESENNSINSSTSTFTDYGRVITVEQESFLEYGN